MGKASPIQAYLAGLSRALWWSGLADASMLAEVESHLREAAERLIAQGAGA